MERLRHLVVVLPGIGGSVLARPGDALPRSRTVWDAGAWDVAAAALLSPRRLSVADHPALTPLALVPRIGFAGPLALPGYAGLVRRLVKTFHARVATASPAGGAPDAHADVLLFPYDFRVGVRAAAHRLRAAVEDHLSATCGTEREKSARVIVIGHSMGGLVARYWLGPLGGASRCAALITLGTPHRGAPKALDWLVNGVLGGSRLFGRATEVLRGWQSVYDLLPRYRMVRADGDGGTGDGSTGDNGARPRYPHELDAALTARVPGFAARARDAFALHEEIRQAWTPGAPAPLPALTAVFSRGHGTPHLAVVTAEGELRVEDADPPWLPNPGWAGDGTVPAISAIPIELDGQRTAWRAVPGKHLMLGSAPEAVRILAMHTSPSLAQVHGETPQGPWLGIDLEDVLLAGTPHRLRVRLLGAEPEAGTRLHAEVRSAPLADPAPASPPPRRRVTDWSDAGNGSWTSMLPPLPPGRYELTVQAVRVPAAGRVTARTVLGVVPPDADAEPAGRAEPAAPAAPAEP
ncbi:esterase/lipase family protein [Streptomyces sp. 6N223]|uniref:esterase/lipase family protein n=1 Tax=Streptomyces sp. 6N223 TaxID=3457412 RepID=UPI003FD33498